MNHRERVMAVFNMKKPDRIPRTASFTAAWVQKFKEATGVENPRKYFDLDYSESYVGFKEPPGMDYDKKFGKYYSESDKPYVFIPSSTYPAEWGIAQKMAGLYHFSCPLFPLKNAVDVSEIENYPFPDYIKDWDHSHFESNIQKIKDGGYPAGVISRWIFQTAWYLRSNVQLFIDFYENPAMAQSILEHVTEVRTAAAIRLAESGADFMHYTDDIGTQRAMMISPELWRKYIKPCTAKMIAAAKKVKPDIILTYHSDGNYEPVIPDLIEIGVDHLTTNQPEAVDPIKLKKEFGKYITFSGTIGCQTTLKFDTPDQVRETVKRQIDVMGMDGGFILSPSNGILPDNPIENVIAMFETVDKYGKY